jgi:excisionase family DNA binding protein
MKPNDPRILAVASAIVGLFDALANERSSDASNGIVSLADAGIERRALRRLIREGRVRATRIGRRVYVSRADLAALLALTLTQVPAASTAVNPQDAARAAYRAPLRAVRRSGQ